MILIDHNFYKIRYFTVYRYNPKPKFIYMR
nr:MAG TPA: hypothetical protein [Caudoviricetes sp.]